MTDIDEQQAAPTPPDGPTEAPPPKAPSGDPALPSHASAWRRRIPLLPALIFTILLTQVPFVLSLWYSLTNWTVNPPLDREFIGLGNYADLPGNDQFVDAAMVSIKITVASVLLSVIFGTLIAILLDRKFFGQGFVRTLIITPFLIMPVVAGLIWKNQMFHALYGVLNWVLETLGFESVEFVSKYPLASIVIVLVWQWTPFMMLIMLAGLQSQPSDVLEAARVDGASSFGIFRQLTLPHLRRYIELGVLLGTIYLIQVFDHIAVITGGGPKSTNLPFYVYRRSIGGGWLFGAASSYSIVVVVASIIIATFALRVLSSLLKGDDAT
ncbi:MAG: sugar ABC transporter permease [Microthrixaceae bacterium]